VIARTAAAVTAAAPMQREAVRTIKSVILSLRPILARPAVRTLSVLRGLLRLAAGDERRQPLDVAVVIRRHRLRPRLELRLRLMLRLIMLWLMLLRLMLLRLVRLRLIRRLVVLRRLLVMLRLIMLLLARIERLRLARREWLAGHAGLVVIAVVVAVIGRIIARAAAGLLLGKRLTLTKLFLRRGDQAEIMFGVLIVIFRRDRISGTLRIAGELEIFFGDVRRRSPDFYVLPIGLVHSGQRILVMMMMATAALATIATAHTLVVLTVSHGLLFCQPRYLRRH
jgi:hypothetical protein